MTYREHMHKAAVDYFTHLMIVRGNCVRQVAIDAGVHRTWLFRKLKELGIRERRPANRGNDAWQSLQ